MKKIIACIIVCCILTLCVGCGNITPSEIQTTNVTSETYMELYVSKNLPKNVITKRDVNHKVLKIEEDNFRGMWVCTVTEDTWNSYYETATKEFKNKIISIIKKQCNEDINISIVSCDIDKTFSSAQILINFTSLFDTQIWNSNCFEINIIRHINDEIEEIGKQYKYTLFGNNQFNAEIFYKIQ